MKGAVLFLLHVILISTTGYSQQLDTLRLEDQYKGGTWGFVQQIKKSLDKLDTSLIPNINSPCFIKAKLVIDTSGNYQSIEAWRNGGRIVCNDYLVTAMYRAIEEVKGGFKPHIKNDKRVPYVVYISYRYQYWR